MSKRRRLDDLMEAITFAEAGETETARKIASRVFRTDAEAGRDAERILAVGGASGFTARIVEKSIAMAERLEYGVVALSVPPAGRLVARLGAPRAPAALPPEVFRERAVERGIPFVHTVRPGDPEQAVAEISRSFRRIAFLLIDLDLAARVRFAGVRLPIFHLADT